MINTTLVFGKLFAVPSEGKTEEIAAGENSGKEKEDILECN